MNILINILGIIVILALVFLLSSKKKSVSILFIIRAVLIQFVIAFILVKIPAGRIVVSVISDGVTAIINCASSGISFVFGSLADVNAPTGSIFFIQVLCNIVFLSAFVSLLYYIGVLGFVVKWIGKGIGKLMGTTEVESFVAVANMFLGQTDSPILVSKYLGKMTDSEVMVVLVSGMGSMSVSILGGYAALGIPMEYLLIASTLVPLGSILVAKIILPQTEEVLKLKDVKMDNKGTNSNAIEAVTEGATVGMKMAISIAASLIAIVSLVTLIDKGLSVFGLSLQQLFSYIFAPFGFLMGLEGSNILLEGQLLGSKVVLNEFVAFSQLGDVMQTLDPRSAMMMAISLCGFANFASLGICVSGIAVLCPEKKSTLARLVFKAMLGGVAVSILNAMIVGVIMSF